MVKLNLNNDWTIQEEPTYTEVSPMVPYNIQSRIDEALDTGVFSFYSNTITQNIPPFTLCEVNETKWWASSEAIRHIPEEGLWRHNVTIIELTKILEKFLIGSKSFTQRTKALKRTNSFIFDVLAQIVFKKYNLRIDFVDCNELMFADHREYTFTQGSTLLDILFEIGRTANGIPRVNNVTYDDDFPLIEISFDMLEQQETFVLNPNQITAITYNQSTDDFVNQMESELTNVVDQTNTVLIDNLVPTCLSSVRINNDNAELVLPTKAHEVHKIYQKIEDGKKELIIRLNASEHVESDNTFSGYLKSFLFRMINDFPSSVGKSWTRTIMNKLESIGIIDTWSEDSIVFTDDDLELVVMKKIVEEDWIIFATFPKPEGFDTPTRNISDFLPSSEPTYIDLTSKLVSYDEYILLTEEEKCGYIYYQNGNDKISGFNVYYDKMWGLLKTNSLIEDIPNIIKDNYIDAITYSTLNAIKYWENEFYLSIGSREPSDDKFVSWKFRVEYTPVVDTFIVANRPGYLSLSKSFEANGNVTDADAAINSINQTLKRTGNQEVIVEFEGLETPNIGDAIELNDALLTVMSVDKEICFEKQINTVTLSKDYKVNELIGIATQYKKYNIPNNEIITRYLNFTYNISDASEVDNFDYLVLCKSDFNVLLPLVRIVTDTAIVLTASTIDNYAASYNSLESRNSGERVREDVKYCDNYGELEGISFYFLPNKKNVGINYPLVSTNIINEEKLSINDSSYFYEIINKDGRERLSFVFQFNIIE